MKYWYYPSLLLPIAAYKVLLRRSSWDIWWTSTTTFSLPSVFSTDCFKDCARAGGLQLGQLEGPSELNLNTLCLTSLALSKFSLSLISVEETILTVFKVNTWPLVTIWGIFSVTNHRMTCHQHKQIRFHKKVTNSKCCTLFTIKLCWISCTVNSKVNWLTEIFVRRAFLSWIFLSISLLRCMIVRLTVNNTTHQYLQMVVYRRYYLYIVFYKQN